MATPPSPPAVIRSLITFFLGGWDLAICADLILQGIIFAQIAHYTMLYERDVLALRAFVAVLLIKRVILWIQDVKYFMNLNAVLGMSTNSWTTELNLTLVALIAFYVQLSFCKRLWAISRNVYIVALVVVLFVFALVAAIESSVFTFAGQLRNVTMTWIEIHLGTVFAGDVLLCGSTIYSLLYTSRHASGGTAGMLNSITKLTFQVHISYYISPTFPSLTGLPGTTPDAYMMLAIIANNMLPKLYAISAMWTLNSRRSIRQAHSSTGRKSSAATGGRRHTIDIELSSHWLSSEGSVVIHVQTEVKTTQYTEPVFSPKHDRPYH
ncbi:hypothetical protein DFH09DRAFT_1436226 [Mycena vulgaris]|nr:hypothetical protein DFH09DRAFT_1436226 [Mycena vulgaris]